MMMLTPGTLVANRFTVEKRAGAGGMGVVFRAVDTLTEKPAAIKVLLSDDPDEIARFERESTFLSMLSHPKGVTGDPRSQRFNPGVVAYLGQGKLESGESFLAMEWLDGCDLAARLKRGPLSVGESLSLLRGAARALETAHAQGIVHRDIKPGNLFLRDEDIEKVAILDFGIARHAAMEAKLTHAGAVIGTPYYMAPEQASGHSDVGAAADVFSLGCVFFECLTGRRPFEGVHALAVLSKIIFDEAPPLESRLPGVDAQLSSLCARMLAKQPHERLGDARALQAALEELGTMTMHEVIVPVSLDVGLTDTISATAVKRAALTGDELEVVCVIAMQDGATETNIMRDIDSATLSLVALGLRVEQLADGTLVSTLARMGQATDQVLRAARAALLLFDRCPGARVALATGRARVGRREGIFVGDAIDRVFRLLDRAHPSEGVYIDELTAGLLDERFVVAKQNDGMVLRAERVVTDESKRLLGRPTPCVGRERELSTLQSHWQDCISEPLARAVLVTAPPGVGKSRVRHEFLQRMRHGQDEHTLIVGRADPIASASLGVVARALRTFFGVEGNDEPAVQRAKVEAFVRAHVESAEARRLTEFLGELVGVPFSDQGNLRLHLARQDARIMTDQLTSAFVSFVQHLLKKCPVLVVLEDLHWCDAFSVALIGALLREAKTQPLFVLAFARPEVHQMFPRLWPDQMEQMSLTPLRPRAAIQLAREVLGDAADAQVLHRITELSGGNALFLEELIRAVADGRGNELPETVLAMVQSRIGRLEPEVRRTLRAASIWGLTCPEEGIRALMGPHIDLAAALGVLIDHEILERRHQAETTGDVEYAFRHALVRDAAYALLVEEDRVLGHRLAAEWLESRGEADPAVMAEHFYLGGEFSRAVPYCVRAVTQMYERGDFHVARRLADLGISSGAEGVHLGVLLGLRAWIIWYTEGSKGWEIVRPDIERAIALLPPMHPWWFRSIANMGGIELLFGAPERAVALVRQMIASPVPSDVGVDYVMSCWGVSALLCQVGRRELAKELIAQASNTIDEIFSHIPIVHAWRQSMHLEYVRHTRPDPWQHRHELEELIRICETSGVTQNHELDLLRNTLAFAHADIGEHTVGETLLRESIEKAKRKGYGYVVTHGQIHLADALCQRARDMPVDEIESITRDLLATPGLTAGFTAMTHGLRAIALLERGDVERAEIECREAIGRSGNFPLRQLRMQATLLRVLVRSGKVPEARELALQSLAKVESLGGVGYAELPIRTAMAMAFHAAGEAERAVDQLRYALAEVNRQASSIPDALLRDRFRREVADNARAVLLAAEWGMES